MATLTATGKVPGAWARAGLEHGHRCCVNVQHAAREYPGLQGLPQRLQAHASGQRNRGMARHPPTSPRSKRRRREAGQLLRQRLAIPFCAQDVPADFALPKAL